MSIRNVTLEDLDRFFYKLQINTLSNIVINFYASYLCLKHSTTHMSYYKFYILATIISGAVMDFHLSFVYGIYLTLPISGSCCTGISRYLGRGGGPIAQYVIIHFTLCAVGASIIFSVLYR